MRELMQSIAVETRQFESLFLSSLRGHNQYEARIFTMEEELDFAGHPLLGGAAVLHDLHSTGDRETWRLNVPAGRISVVTEKVGPGRFRSSMEQPRPVLGPVIDRTRYKEIAGSLSLTEADLHPDLPMQVVSTGLPYLIVPLKTGLDRSAIAIPGFEEFLSQFGAKFVYVYDVDEREGRTWDNAGTVEDIATGSAAGPTAAYLCHHSYLEVETETTIRQGSFVGRPSEMSVRVQGSRSSMKSVIVSGYVTMVASGRLQTRIT